MEFAYGSARRAFGSSRKILARRSPNVAIWVGLVALATSFCQGCLVLPVRAPTRTNGFSGSMDKVNLNFIEAGKSTREEITQKLGGMDTGVKDDRIFLGRWASSSWGVLWMIAGNNSADGGWNRGWARHNVLVAFDDKGVVQQVRVFPDEELVKQLSAWVAQGQSQPLDLSTPIEIPVEHRHASGRSFSGMLVLGNDSFEFRENNNGKHDFKIPPAQIHELRLTSVGHGDKSDPRFMNQTIHFTEKTNVGSKMTIRVDVPAVMTLVKYLAQTRSNKPAGGPALRSLACARHPVGVAFRRVEWNNLP